MVFMDPSKAWNVAAIISILLTFLSVFIFDALIKAIGQKNITLATAIGLVLISGFVALMVYGAGFRYGAYVIHLGTAFGSIMAFNVWFRIWPAQQKIITAIKNGEKPDADLVAMAGLRSKCNTYLSVPLIWTMINAHSTWAASQWWILIIFVVVGFHAVQHLYKRAAKVKGF
jgi:uncharacterized membrane protein